MKTHLLPCDRIHWISNGRLSTPLVGGRSRLKLEPDKGELRRQRPAACVMRVILSRRKFWWSLQVVQDAVEQVGPTGLSVAAGMVTLAQEDWSEAEVG